MSRATYVPRRKEGDNPVYFNNFRERIQEFSAVGRAGRENKGDARHTFRRGSEDGQEPRGVVDGAVILLRRGDGRDNRAGKWGRDRLG